jgi:hypothetical protein
MNECVIILSVVAKGLKTVTREISTTAVQTCMGAIICAERFRKFL